MFELPLDQGAVFTRRQLLHLGCTDHYLRQLVDAGTLRRLRQGVYTVAPPASSRDIAVAVGGSITCASALREHGIWVPMGESRLHLRVTRRQRDRRAHQFSHFAPGAVIHVDDCSRTPTSIMDDVANSLRCASECFATNELVAMLESAQRSGCDLVSLRALQEGANKRMRNALTLAHDVWSEPTSMSGAETLLRLALQRARISFRQQVEICGYYADFLVGDWLVVEVDGFEFHAGQQQFRHDRQRDRAFTQAGFHKLRFTALEIYDDIEHCVAEILSLVRADVHRRPSTRSSNVVRLRGSGGVRHLERPVSAPVS